ncbi:MAG: hypothetical protein QNJ61_08220 [Desulfobacterales bacterium]|nr:hypothetical protein [Desulfobacterales bacterium]
MFIPNYQIHNILKDFTRQLKKIRQRRKSPADPGTVVPARDRRPSDLRLTAVASKVTANIMDRIASLGEEARHSPPMESERPPRGADAQPPAFDYHLLDREKGKVKQQLVVEDSRILVARFQQMTAAEPPKEEIETQRQP